jgi:hypothetical protein
MEDEIVNANLTFSFHEENDDEIGKLLGNFSLLLSYGLAVFSS